MIKKIARYIVRQGTECTVTGNFIFGFDELANRFGVTESFIEKSADDIVAELCRCEEVIPDDQMIDRQSKAFSIIFGTLYCPNIEED